MKNLEDKSENKIMSNENIGGKNWWKNLEQWKTQRNNLSNRSTYLWLNSVSVMKSISFEGQIIEKKKSMF